MHPTLHRSHQGFWAWLYFSCLSILICAAEAPAVSWATLLPTDAEGIALVNVASAGDGGFYCFSQSAHPLIKFSSALKMEWQLARSRGSNDIGRVSNVAVLAGGDAVVLLTASQVQGARIFEQAVAPEQQALVRVTAAGSLVWLRPISGAVMTALAATGAGGFALAGFGSGVAQIGGDQINLNPEGYFVARFNDSLNSVVIGRSAPVSANYISALHLDRGGDLLISGKASSPTWTLGGTTLAGPGVFLARLNGANELTWARRLSTNGTWLASAKNLDGPGAVAWRAANGESFVSQISSEGAALWQQPVSGQINALVASEATYVAGVEYPFENWFVTALDQNGAVLWHRGEPARSRTSGRGAALLDNRRLLVVGESILNGTFFDDFFLSDPIWMGQTISGGFLAALDLQGPTFRVQPKSQAAAVGGSVTLTAEIYSSTPLALQWLKDGQPVPSQDGLDLHLANLQKNDAGEYRLSAASSSGAATSSVARVQVNSFNIKTIAGSGVAGFENSTNALAASLKFPRNPLALPDGRLLVTESSNAAIRVVAGGALSTFGASSAMPSALAFQPYSYQGPSLILADAQLNGLRFVTLTTNTFDVLSIGPVEGAAQLRKPNSVATLDGLDFVVLSEANGTRVWKYKDGDISVLAGDGAGFVDGNVEDARFGEISAVTLDVRANIYVADRGNHAIRKITLSGRVTTLAGTNSAGFRDGVGMEARFNEPSGLAADESGNIYVTEIGNHSVRRISPAGEVATVAGGPGEALFNAPEGIAVLPNSLIVADTGQHRIREIELAPSGEIRLAISMEAGLTITVTGADGTYAIEWSRSVGAGAEWELATTATAGVPQVLTPPTETRFYRARPNP